MSVSTRAMGEESKIDVLTMLRDGPSNKVCWWMVCWGRHTWGIRDSSQGTLQH